MRDTKPCTGFHINSQRLLPYWVSHHSPSNACLPFKPADPDKEQSGIAVFPLEYGSLTQVINLDRYNFFLLWLAFHRLKLFCTEY